MKIWRYAVLNVLLLSLLWAAGCDNGGGGPTGPANAPVLSNITATPNSAHPGAYIIFEVDFVDVNGDLHEGTAIITDNRDETGDYPPVPINAPGTSGRFSISVELSVLAAPGEITFYVSAQDTAGNESNMLPVTITIVSSKIMRRRWDQVDFEMR